MRHTQRGATMPRAAVLMGVLALALVIVGMVGLQVMKGTIEQRKITRESKHGTPAAATVVAAPVAVASVAPAVSVEEAPLPALARLTPEEEAAREANWREARLKAIEIQQELRAKANAAKAAAEKPKGKGETRCVGGQQMRRVENGWVQDGVC